MNDRVFKNGIAKLRSKKRLELLELERVIEFCLEKIYVTRVLDVGTGSGVFAEAFALRNLEVTGIDSNPDMIEAATLHVGNAHFEVATAEALPYHDKSFDLVFLGHVLHESDDPALTLREARRVAVMRVMVLEWSYREEEMGPPLAHRMKPETILDIAHKAGFKKPEKIELQHMILYRMNI